MYVHLFMLYKCIQVHGSNVEVRKQLTGLGSLSTVWILGSESR